MFQKNKILIVSNSYWNLYNFRYELIRELEKKNKIYLVAHPDKYQQKFNFPDITVNPINIYSRSKNLLLEITLFFKLLFIVSKIRPDYILSFTIKPNIYLSLISRIFKIRLITNITGLGLLNNKNYFGKFILMIYKTIIKNNYMNFCQNKTDFDEFKKSLNIKLIPGSGVNTRLFKPSKSRKENETVFLMVSRIFFEKGIEYFMDSVKYFNDMGDMKLKFILIGPIIEKKYENLILNNNYKNFSYLGMKDNLYDYYKNADFIIYPSFYSEGTPRVLLESMSCGKPIITTTTNGCRQLFDNNVNIGFLIKKNSLSSLISAIKKASNISHEKRLVLSKNCRKLVEEKFSVEKVIAQYKALIT